MSPSPGRRHLPTSQGHDRYRGRRDRACHARDGWLTSPSAGVSTAARYSAATISSSALIPVTNVTVCNRPPTSDPIRFAPRAASFRSAAANDRMKTIPLKSIGRLVSRPDHQRLRRVGQEREPRQVEEVEPHARQHEQGVDRRQRQSREPARRSRFASRIITMTPEMMTAFTTQVLPSTTAALLMFCTSSSMNAAPRKKKCQLAPVPTAPPRRVVPSRSPAEGEQHRPEAAASRKYRARERRLLQVDVRPVVGRRRGRAGQFAAAARRLPLPDQLRQLRVGGDAPLDRVRLSPATNITPPQPYPLTARGTPAARGRTPPRSAPPCGRRCTASGLEAQHHHAAGLEQRRGLRDALRRVDVVVEPGVGHRRRRVRVEQTERDHVELLGAGGEVGAGVVVDHHALAGRSTASRGGIVCPIVDDAGSISTATTRSTPFRSVPAASLPLPAPTISMLSAPGASFSGQVVLRVPRWPAGIDPGRRPPLPGAGRSSPGMPCVVHGDECPSRHVPRDPPLAGRASSRMPTLSVVGRAASGVADAEFLIRRPMSFLVTGFEYTGTPATATIPAKSRTSTRRDRPPVPANTSVPAANRANHATGGNQAAGQHVQPDAQQGCRTR